MEDHYSLYAVWKWKEWRERRNCDKYIISWNSNSKCEAQTHLHLIRHPKNRLIHWIWRLKSAFLPRRKRTATVSSEPQHSQGRKRRLKLWWIKFSHHTQLRSDGATSWRQFRRRRESLNTNLFVAVVVWCRPLQPGRPCIARIESGLEQPELTWNWLWAASAALNFDFLLARLLPGLMP